MHCSKDPDKSGDYPIPISIPGHAGDYPYTDFHSMTCWRLPLYLFPFQDMLEITPIPISIPGHAGGYSYTYFHSRSCWRLPLYLFPFQDMLEITPIPISIPGHAGDYPYTYFHSRTCWRLPLYLFPFQVMRRLPLSCFPFQVMLEITPIPVRSVGKVSSVLNCWVSTSVSTKMARQYPRKLLNLELVVGKLGGHVKGW